MNPRITKTANSKAANNEGRLYLFSFIFISREASSFLRGFAASPLMASYHDGQRSIISLASMDTGSRLSNALIDSLPLDLTRSGQVSSNFTRQVILSWVFMMLPSDCIFLLLEICRLFIDHSVLSIAQSESVA